MVYLHKGSRFQQLKLRLKAGELCVNGVTHKYHDDVSHYHQAIRAKWIYGP